jgi:integrase
VELFVEVLWKKGSPMSEKKTQLNRVKSSRKHRVGRVTIYLRGKIWYIYYCENGGRVRRRVGVSLGDAKRLAAQANAQLATHTPAILSFQPVSVFNLRQRWLSYHEELLRSSLATIRRYRAATDHLLQFVKTVRTANSADAFTISTAEEFAHYLRREKVSPNGHPNTAKKLLRDKGVIFILETCRTMFNYAAKHRHLPPYHENPFALLNLGRIPIEDAKPIELFTSKQEEAFWAACDNWQFPIFLTMALTGLRPGEVVHLLLPNDVDGEHGLIRVRNKSDLGWRTKTRNERDIPIICELADVLHQALRDRQRGPLFLRRRFYTNGQEPVLVDCDRRQLAIELGRQVESRRLALSEAYTRFEEARIAKGIWRDAGATKEAVLRLEFMEVTASIGLPHLTCPKLLRHMFATSLQEANVDPLIRQELMGHSVGSHRNGGLGMTAVYTHTQDRTRRKQLEAAMAKRQAAVEAARRWLEK